MKELILLGAGASIEAGIPGAYDMTKKILNLFEKIYYDRRSFDVLRFVVGGLLFRNGVAGQDPFQGVNVEDLFNAVDLLANRHSLEATPFINAWHHRVDDLERELLSRSDIDRVKNALYADLSHDLSRKLRRGFLANSPIDEGISKAFESLSSYGRYSSDNLSREIESIYDRLQKSPGGYIFQDTSLKMIQKLKSIVWLEDMSRVLYLNDLVTFAEKHCLTIATLNYDNCIELCAEGLGAVVDTGIETWSKSGNFDLRQDGIRLLKLHGSIDWKLEDSPVSKDRPYPNKILSKVTTLTNEKSAYRPALIFGQRNKLTAEGPFLDLLRGFQESLEQTKLLTVIGYSFRDDHINEFIGLWLNGNPNRKLRIFNGESFMKEPTPFIRQLSHVAENRIVLSGKRASDAIRECYGK